MIESTLGLELYEGDDEGQGGSQERGLMSEARESLKEACAVVVEDAINAVLLGLRESVSLSFNLLPFDVLRHTSAGWSPSVRHEIVSLDSVACASFHFAAASGGLLLSPGVR